MKCLPLLLLAVAIAIVQAKHSTSSIKGMKCGKCQGVWKSCKRSKLNSNKCMIRLVKCLKNIAKSTICDGTCDPECKHGICINGKCKCVYGFEGLGCEKEACMDYWGKEKCKWYKKLDFCDDPNFINCKQTCGRCKKCDKSITTDCGKKGGVCQESCNKWELECTSTNCSNNCKCCAPLDKAFLTGSNEIWSSEQCPRCEGSFGGSLTDCLYRCLQNSTCTVINYFEGDQESQSICLPASCDPVPQPQSYREGYKGYEVNTDLRKYFTQKEEY